MIAEKTLNVSNQLFEIINNTVFTQDFISGIAGDTIYQVAVKVLLKITERNRRRFICKNFILL